MSSDLLKEDNKLNNNLNNDLNTDLNKLVDDNLKKDLRNELKNSSKKNSENSSEKDFSSLFSLFNVKPRLYQELIFNSASKKNTLVVLPTGLGKTLIAHMLIFHRLTLYPDKKVIFLAPTKPLIEQHFSSFNYGFLNEKKVLFTGSVSPAKRKDLFSLYQIIFTTPQGLENDLLSNRLSLKDISLIIFDEAHKATGNYSYVYIAKRFYQESSYPLILGLTASPGSNKEKILEVCKNLYIESIEVRTTDDPDVKPYVKKINYEFIEIDLSFELKKIVSVLKKIYSNRFNEFKELTNTKKKYLSKTELLELQVMLYKKANSYQKDFDSLRGLSVLAELMKLQHAIDLAETQGVEALNLYLNQLKEEGFRGKTKAAKNLVENPDFKEVIFLVENLIKKGLEHPKLKALKKRIAKELNANKNAKIIIFTQYRDQASVISRELNKLNINSKVFVGQAKKRGVGLSQNEQKKIIDDFSNNKFPVLIATSVAEEGLDIPKVDLVIFYEPIPSAIRTVQRRGRTGRLEEGKVVFLITKGTKDNIFRWSAHHKEKKMYRAIKELKKDFSLKNPLKELNKEEKESSFLKKYSLNHFLNDAENNNKIKNNKEDLLLIDSSFLKKDNLNSFSLKKNNKNINNINARSINNNDLNNVNNIIDNNTNLISNKNANIKNSNFDSSLSNFSFSNSRSLNNDSFNNINSFKPKLLIDFREKGSPVIKNLINLNMPIELTNLDVGDYQVSERVVIEYKRIPDFIYSLIDHRIFEQLNKLRSFSRPLIIIEGDEDLYSVRQVHPNAINGLLATIAINYGIPLIFTKTPFESASLIKSIFEREYKVYGEQKTITKPFVKGEEQISLLSMIPGINYVTAKNLLKRFKSIKNIFNSTLDELKKTPLVGSKKAEQIIDFINKEYIEK